MKEYIKPDFRVIELKVENSVCGVMISNRDIGLGGGEGEIEDCESSAFRQGIWDNGGDSPFASNSPF